MTIPHGTEKPIGASPVQKARISSASEASACGPVP